MRYTLAWSTNGNPVSASRAILALLSGLSGGTFRSSPKQNTVRSQGNRGPAAICR